MARAIGQYPSLSTRCYSNSHTSTLSASSSHSLSSICSDNSERFNSRFLKFCSSSSSSCSGDGILQKGLSFKSRKHVSTLASLEVPDFLPHTWIKRLGDKPVGPKLSLSAEEATFEQLEALKNNDDPYPDHGVEVMYRFAGFDPFKRSKYFGRSLDLGQFERFRRIFHHSTYRVLLCHKKSMILSSLRLTEHCCKQRVLVLGARPSEEEIFEFTLVQQVGGNWDGYWLTESLLFDGEGIIGSIAY